MASLFEALKSVVSGSGNVEISKEVEKELKTVTDKHLTEFITAMTKIQYDRKSKFEDYEEMGKDSIIQSAIELMADDATQTDLDKGKSVWVEYSDNKKIEKELNRFLVEDFKIEKRLWSIAYNVVHKGEVYVNTFESDEGFQKFKKSKKQKDLFHFQIEKEPENISHLLKYGESVGYFISVEENSKGVKHRIYPPTEFIHFLSDRASNREDIKIEIRKGEDIEEETYKIKYGTSFIDAAREAHKVMSLIDNILLTSRLSRSVLYRVISVNVGNAGRTETIKILNEIKRSINSRESIDVNSKQYRSEKSPLPVNENVYVPTRNGKGDLRFDSVGGDMNVRDIVDVEYFRNRLFAALKVPKAFMGFEESLPGGIGDTSLTRLDIRYARTIKRVQDVLREGIKDACNYYLLKNDKSGHIDKFSVHMARISSAEDSDKANDLQNRLNVADSIIRTLKDGFQDKFDEEKLLIYILEHILRLDSVEDFIKKEEGESKGNEKEDKAKGQDWKPF